MDVKKTVKDILAREYNLKSVEEYMVFSVQKDQSVGVVCPAVFGGEMNLRSVKLPIQVGNVHGIGFLEGDLHVGIGGNRQLLSHVARNVEIRPKIRGDLIQADGYGVGFARVVGQGERFRGSIRAYRKNEILV